MNYNENCDLIDLFKISTKESTCENVDVFPYLSYGLFFVDEKGKLIRYLPYDIAEYCKNRYGLVQTDWSMTFHKSIEKVFSADYIDLVSEQLMHYFSTYGMESMGFKAMPYIPVEDLNIEENENNVTQFQAIKIVSEKTAIAYIDNYMRTTIAPNKNSMITQCLMEKTTVSINDIKSFELKSWYCNLFGVVPSDPTDFLRYMVYNSIGSTLLIKNDEEIEAIRMAGRTANKIGEDKVAKRFSIYSEEILAEIFYRYKPIFLAFKEYDNCAPIINRIRRLAKTYHKPLSDVNVQNFSRLVKEKRFEDAQKVIKRANNRQLIKLYNFAYYEDLSKAENRIYNIRNGKLYVDECRKISDSNTSMMLYLIRNEIRTRHPEYKGKKFYIPNGIEYSAPTSEKQFVDNIPYGTKIFCPSDKAFGIGIYWENKNNERVDLDLHLTGLECDYGWNAMYRDDSNIAFSGDMTDATNGAAEAFYIKDNKNPFILSVSNFTRTKGEKFKVLITDKDFINPKADKYSALKTPPINVSDAIVSPINLEFSNKDAEPRDKTIGLVYNSALMIYGGSFTSNNIPNRKMQKEAIVPMVDKAYYTLSLQKFLKLNGAVIYNDESFNKLSEEEKEEVTALTPESVIPSTFFELIDEKVS